MNIKKVSSTESCICRVINSPLVSNDPYSVNQGHTLLHYICENSIGYIIDFILKTSDSINVFYIQDDDGNTPLHLLCERVDELEVNNEDYDGSHMANYTSVPSSTKAILMINYLAQYVELSIKNKKKLLPEDLTTNILVHNICYRQTVQKKNNKFPLPKPINNNIIYKSDWNALFNLKDPKQKNRTLLHHLCVGDRLGAIKFLVENGGDVNIISSRKDRYSNHNVTPIDILFSTKSISFPSNRQTTYTNINVPSGFRRVPEIVSGNSKDLILNKSEKIILEETEMIAKYLVEKGANLSLNSYCDISDIMYKLNKNKNTNTEKESLLSDIKSRVKSISNSLIKYSCFPFGSFINNVYKDNKRYNEVKFITIPSIRDKNSKNEEKLPLL